MRPKVILYNAVSVDGRTTGFAVEMGVFYGLAQRWGEGASLVGCDTLLSAPGGLPEDDAEELPPAAPSPDDPRPMLVVTDSRGRLKSWGYLRQQPFWKDYVALCTEATSPAHRNYLRRKGVKTIVAGRDRVDLRAALEELGRSFGVTTVRVDSGGTLNAVLLRAGLADQLHLLVHPVLAGAASDKTFFPVWSDGVAGAAAESIPLRFLAAEPVADGLVLLSYAVEK